MTGEDILEAGLNDSHYLVHGDHGESAEALDPVMITGIVTAILEVIRSCRSPENAARQISRGGHLSKKHVRRILKKKGYPRDKRDEVAGRMAEKGRRLTEDEIQSILNDSDDVPEPPPETGGEYPYWPGATAILLLCLLPVSANAAEEYRWWPMVEQAKVETESYWPIPAKAKPARIIQLRDKVCIRAIEDEKILFPRLKASGWKIGPGPENHIQTIFVEDHPDLARKYGYRNRCPTYVAVVNDRVVSRWEGRIPENTVATMLTQAVSALKGNTQQASR